MHTQNIFSQFIALRKPELYITKKNEIKTNFYSSSYIWSPEGGCLSGRGHLKVNDIYYYVNKKNNLQKVFNKS